jgi:FKBP-type peptidyl-prolyl cis-trans isomerase SlyD
MKVTQDSVVTFHYTLKDEAGAVIDQSDGEPMAYLHGHGQIVPGLERELTGRSAGEKLQVQVPLQRAMASTKLPRCRRCHATPSAGSPACM